MGVAVIDRFAQKTGTLVEQASHIATGHAARTSSMLIGRTSIARAYHSTVSSSSASAWARALGA